ncbi:MAG: NUDIX domain-containing protein [Salibacteraceae bacterium]
MTTAVIIARFQTPYLHEGHHQLIQQVREKHNKLIIVLGISAILGSRRNPYDYHTREKMLKTAYPEVVVLPLRDQPEDHRWSVNLDELLGNAFPNEQFELYGGRDSFVPYYQGRYPTVELPQHGQFNATEIRNRYADKVGNSDDFRAGILYAYHNQFTKVYPTVDVVVFRNDRREMLLGKKANNLKWRLVGGFADPEDESFEAAARRELLEECGPIEVSEMRYEMSLRVDDWRYRNEADKITTTVFSCDHLFGTPKAQDDIVDVAWHPLDHIWQLLQNQEITPAHLPIFEKLLAKYNAQ